MIPDPPKEVALALEAERRFHMDPEFHRQCQVVKHTIALAGGLTRGGLDENSILAGAAMTVLLKESGAL